MIVKAELMTAEDMSRALKRISHQIIERNHGADNLVLLGVKRRGLPLAQRLAKNILAIEGVTVPVGELDITLYRDDLTEIQPDPVIHPSNIDFDINGKDVILVDDVFYTGRTARAALDAAARYGRAYHPARGADRSRTPRASNPCRLRRQKRADGKIRTDRRQCHGD